MGQRAVRRLAVLALTAGALAVAPSTPASATVLPVDADGCPANGNPAGALPCAVITPDCVGLDLLLSNAAAAGANAVFELTGVVPAIGFGVEPGESLPLEMLLPEDQTVSVSIVETTTGQAFYDDEPVTKDCTNPSAGVGDVSCPASAVVSVSNPGGTTGTTSVDFKIDVYRNGATTPSRTTLDDVTGDASTAVALIGDGSARIVVTGVTTTGPGVDDTVEVVADRTQTVDCDGPTITLTTPVDGATFVRGQTVLADYACADLGSGAATCNGLVVDGAAIDTSTLGDHTFTVDATDSAMHSSSASADYSVVAATCIGRPATVDLRFSEHPTAGDDVIVGTPGNDVIDGRGGDDLICGWGGDDDIQGGGGMDFVRGGKGRDQLFAGAAGGLLDGGPGADQLFGGPDNDSLKGGTGVDALSGRAGNDLGDGGDQRDTCDLGSGHDTYRHCEITTE